MIKRERERINKYRAVKGWWCCCLT